MPPILAPYTDAIWKLASTILIVILTLVANYLIRGFLRRRLKGSAHAYTLRMLVRNAVLIAAAVWILAIWLDAGSSFTVAMGIFGAGIAFASQEIIGSFAGFINILTGSIFHIGDRVRIGNVTGDVLDISLLRTTVMEIGDWVHADQYTGRIVTIANRDVFSDPVFNYTQYWSYLWDEITIPITYTSDWRRAGEIMLAHGQEYTEHLQAEAQAGLEAIDRRYPALEDTTVAPTLYTRMTDNWVEMTLRYVVEARSRRSVTAQLHRDLLTHFEEAPDVSVASATFEIIGLPTVKHAPVDSRAK
jgi:small-conductance mechanosensitive channel